MPLIETSLVRPFLDLSCYTIEHHPYIFNLLQDYKTLNGPIFDLISLSFDSKSVPLSLFVYALQEGTHIGSTSTPNITQLQFKVKNLI